MESERMMDIHFTCTEQHIANEWKYYILVPDDVQHKRHGIVALSDVALSMF